MYSSGPCCSPCEDQLNLPELDICPAPKAADPLAQGAACSSLCDTPLEESEYVLASEPYEYCTQSLPRPQRRHPVSSDADLGRKFERKKRHASMNLKRSLRSSSELDMPEYDAVKFPRRPDSLTLPTLSASISTTTLERYCVDTRTKLLSLDSPEGATCSAFLSPPDTASGLTESFSTDSRSLTSAASQNSALSPISPRLRPRASFRSRSFRQQTFSPHNSPIPSMGVVLTEENSREEGEPILVGVKPIARAFSFRMPWEQQQNHAAPRCNKGESKAQLGSTQCSITSLDSLDCSLSPSRLKSPSPPQELQITGNAGCINQPTVAGCGLSDMQAEWGVCLPEQFARTTTIQWEHLKSG